MSIVINYDFFNAIRDVNEIFNGFKVIRNNQKNWIKYNLPIFISLDLLLLKGNPRGVLLALLAQGNLSFGLELFKCTINNEDIYKKKSEENLKRTIPLLEKINVITTYDLVIKSELLNKVVNLNVNDTKIPMLVSSKYLLIPTIDYNGSIVDTPIIQEHILGSDAYILSKGREEKKLKLVYKRA